MIDPSKKTQAVLITGPTASGKSALAVHLAERLNGVVINADSMQVYDTLRLITARPDETDLNCAEHHLYGHVTVQHAYSTGEWLRDVKTVLADVQARQLRPIIVGGTGLYFKALTGGLSDMPKVPDELRHMLRERLEGEGSARLHEELAERDAIVAQRLDPSDGQRIVRALEIVISTGRSISEFQNTPGPVLVAERDACKLVVLPERDLLYRRINDRFTTMMDGGAVDEVQVLLSRQLSGDLPAMRAIGVAQIAEYLAGKISRDRAIELASIATRQYAKRQMTWFRNQMDDAWRRIDIQRQGLDGVFEVV